VAIKPTDTAYTDEELKLIKKIEKSIDEDLLRFNPPGNEVRQIDLDAESFTPQEADPLASDYEDTLYWIMKRIFPGALERFKESGWEIDFVDNLNNTLSVSFTPKQ